MGWLEGDFDFFFLAVRLVASAADTSAACVSTNHTIYIQSDRYTYYRDNVLFLTQFGRKSYASFELPAQGVLTQISFRV